MFFYSLQIALGYDVDDEAQKNWDITSPKSWKSSETKKSSNGVKLRCNADSINTEATSILVYTDIYTQEVLARYKHAKWYACFQDTEIPSDYMFDSVLNSYNNVKDISWPDIASYSDISSLPKYVKQELIEDFGFPVDMDNPFAWFLHGVLKDTFDFNGVRVYNDVAPLLNANYKFLLQDVVRTKFDCVCDALQITNNEKVKQHIEQWLQLHPENIQKMLLSDI